MKKFTFNFYSTVCLIFLMACSLNLSAQSLVAVGYGFTPSSKTFTYLPGTATNVSSIQTDDAASSPLPVGFNFTFCGVDYNQVIACSNGWLLFGSTNNFGSYNYNPYTAYVSPAVWALWEDISCSGATCGYLTTGTPGSQVFTMEWRDVKWDYGASNASISFQVKLYEATGQIECLYQQESGSVDLSSGSSPGCTIGIGNSTSDWQTLDGTGTSPTPSKSSWNYMLTGRPASGQSYMWDPGPICTIPSGFVVNNVNSTTVDLSWTAISGTAGYEYVIDQLSTNPTASTALTTTTSNNIVKTGLTPSTTYSLHMRNSCGQYNKSKWALYTFTTLPVCSKPSGFIKTNVDTNKATITWSGVPAATTFQYVFDTDRTNPPTDPSKFVPTTANSITKTGLDADVTYYIHVRTICPGKDTTIWVLDSVHTPIPCRAPRVELVDLTSTRAIFTWAPVRSAVSYEYYFGNPTTPPAFGTPAPPSNTILQPFLQPGTEYQMHVRCSCLYEGVKTASDWGSLGITTKFPLNIDNVNSNTADITVYPNPVKDLLNFITEAAIGKDAAITISDMTGKTINNIAVTSRSMPLDMHALAPGVYLLKYDDGNGNKKVIKVTKE